MNICEHPPNTWKKPIGQPEILRACSICCPEMKFEVDLVPDYYCASETILKFATIDPKTDDEMDVRAIARELLEAQSFLKRFEDICTSGSPMRFVQDISDLFTQL